ncbi:MarR family winged helix-turn-helix transcriptional regulator [Williamsia maris]|uniref:DNA-binding transcriptional regulator, MarR family n=1 Tax=Williamsia maris TaxID=72806 RepID=A0ABT1H947_9NOCA|nr:MarR family transcriptional regulator [Williamsia maris]MCP2174739.1 DNA-binding transcriptional regulator, MarR family [Williamsia maris]
MSNTSAARAAQRERLMESLQTYGADFSEFGRRFAGWLGLHSTDAEALLQIIYAEQGGAPLSPARLAERIHLTSGATTSLLNRLESAGFVSRTREHSDRRIVTLRSEQSVHDRADEFFDPLGVSIDAVMSGYPPEMLVQFEKFMGDLHATMQTRLGEV